MNAMRAILDVWKEGSLPKPLLREAFRQAMKQGKITKTRVAMYQRDAESAPVLAEIQKGTK